VIQNPLRTPLKLHAPAFLACACWPPLVFFPPRPCSVWSCLLASWSVVLVGVCGSPSFVFLVCFVGVACFLFGLVCLVLLCVGCLLLISLVCFCFCWLRLTSYWTGTFVCFAFTCATKALIYHCTCVSVRRLDRFTCTVDSPVNHVLAFWLLCNYPQSTEVTKDD